MSAAETSDLHFSTLNALTPQSVDVLVLYSRTWEPRWGVCNGRPCAIFSAASTNTSANDPAEVRQHFGLVSVQRRDQRGQWIEIFARP